MRLHKCHIREWGWLHCDDLSIGMNDGIVVYVTNKASRDFL